MTIPRGWGDKIKIPRWQTPVKTTLSVAGLSGALTAISQVTEANVTGGPTVNAFKLGASYISGSTVQFAGARAYTDKLILITRANYVEGALESLSRELAFRIDRYTRQNISSSAVVRSAGTGATAKTTDILVGKEIAKLAPLMDAYNVPRWDDNNFVMLTHPLAQYDLFKDVSATGLVTVARYNDPERIYKGEVGQMYGVRLLLSNAIAKKIGTGNSGLSSVAATTGIQSYVFAPDSFYSLELEGGGVEVIHHPLGSSGSAVDPANQVGSLAVKVHYGVAPAPQGDSRLMIFAHGLSLVGV